MNKQSNERFIELIEYIEDNLCEDIDYKKLSQILGVNEYTMHRIFLFVTNYTLAEYIRKRRLSMAALDLIDNGDKIIDIAIKYNYDSPQAFSRAFKAMMGFLPSEINNNRNNMKFFSKYELIDEELDDEIDYKIERNIEFNLYAISMKTTIRNCHNEAPIFWKNNRYKLEGKSRYGLLDYDKTCAIQDATYYIASKEKFDGSEPLKIRRCNYFVYESDFVDGATVDKLNCKIYRILLEDRYELIDLPDIEEYLPNNRMKMYIPIK